MMKRWKGITVQVGLGASSGHPRGIHMCSIVSIVIVPERLFNISLGVLTLQASPTMQYQVKKKKST